MLDKIVTIGSILAMGFAVLLWAQATFVAGADFTQYQYYEVEDEIIYLEDKKLRLEKQGKTLEYEDQRQLDRQRLKLQSLEMQVGK